MPIRKHRSEWSWVALAIMGGCAAEEPAPSFSGGRPHERDAQVADAQVADAPVADAQLPTQQRDATLPDAAPADADTGPAQEPEDAAVLSAPGAEVGRLAGFTAAHNAARRRVQTEPALMDLSWSTEVALVAQAYADRLAAGCLDSLMHSPSEARQGWGENLASYGIMGGTGNEPNGTAEGVVELWESELACYTYGPFASGTNATCSAACEDYGGCGHYTQLVWRRTQRVGCGVADCRADGWRKTYWVCNYDPPGNFSNQRPY